jgi:hypothetical protein
MAEVIFMAGQYVNTSVEFKTTDPFLGELYRAAEAAEKGNEKDFSGRTVLIEGGGYESIWLETQPMGGEMYAKRGMTAAMNNVLFFMDYQLLNGRYPGVIDCKNGTIAPRYTHIQGFCFPCHALNLYYWNKKQDQAYLRKLYQSLEAWDNYLWQYRDSDGDGCLESWCVWDTGEDNSNRFAGTSLNARGWPGEEPPRDAVFPVESMDMMSYSYDARKTLARIAALIGNGQEKLWDDRAKAVQDKLHACLWDETRGACFDRDNQNRFMPALQHNNLRAMYHGSFTREMAGRFVKEHLLNPEEFLTFMPLPSIAVNNPVFRNIPENNWSGQPEGLTYQRAIRALENYGYLSEITLFGEKLLNTVGKRNTFPQQFDPFTGEFSEAGSRKDYGPTALSVLEYISRLYGVHIQFDEVYWGALGREKQKTTYTQFWDGDTFTVESVNGETVGTINAEEIFRTGSGVRVVTGWDGRVTRIINISGVPLAVDCTIRGNTKRFDLRPNQIQPISPYGAD